MDDPVPTLDSEIRSRIVSVTKSSIGLVSILLAFLFLSGEVLPLVNRDGGVWSLVFLDRSQGLLPKLGAILLWDVILFLGILTGLNHGLGRDRRTSSVLALVMSLVLWRVLYGIVAGLSAPDPDLARAAIPRNVSVLISFIGILAAWKETIFRKAATWERKFKTPIFGVIAWHHRKDAIFNILFLAGFGMVRVGFPPDLSAFLLAFLKLGLLGNAVVGIFRSCLREAAPALTAEPGNV